MIFVQDETIASIASGMGGGIGVVRISGKDALKVAGKIFRLKKNIESESGGKSTKAKWNTNYFKKKPSHTITYGFIVDDGKIIDEAIVLLMKAPNSYTREDVVEIDAHGGPFVLKKILEAALKNGARLAQPGEFTKRAFLNGRIDLSQAEAVMKVISSENSFALESAMSQLEGTISKYIEEIRSELLHNIGYIEAALDDPEHYDLDEYKNELLEKTESEIKKLNVLLDRFDDGRLKTEGIRTAIVGRPNAGKSSLMNLLLDEDRAIVSKNAGTTRDVLEESIRLDDLILRLADTAGIREADDEVERIGIDRAMKSLNDADFIIYVMDASVGITKEDTYIMDAVQEKNGIVLLNKFDLGSVITKDDVSSYIKWDCIEFSNKTKKGLDILIAYIKDKYLNGKISYNDQACLTSVRHKEAVETALRSLENAVTAIKCGMSEDFAAIDLMEAYKNLGLINGETASEDLINKIFSDFCMGK